MSTTSRRAAVAVNEYRKLAKSGEDFPLGALAEAMSTAQDTVARPAPATPQSPLGFMVADWSDSASLSAAQISTAEEMVAMLLAFGDRDHGVLMCQNALDREIVQRLADQINRVGYTVPAKVGEIISKRAGFKLSRQTVDNRSAAWCKRVAKKLRATFPDLFGPSEIARDLRKNGANLVDVANELMARGIAAPRGGKVWQATQVSRLLDQAA
jgi:hypothetical protein